MTKKKLTWQQKFERFDAEHPEIYAAFKEFAERLLDRGFKRYSAQTIYNVLRFHSDLDARTTGERFKLPQNYNPYYARKLMKEDPRFEGFFETRQLRSVAA